MGLRCSTNFSPESARRWRSRARFAQGPGYGYGPGMMGGGSGPMMGGYGRGFGGPMTALNRTDEQHEKLFAIREEPAQELGQT